MQTPLFRKSHVRDYLRYGTMAAAGYLAAELVFVLKDDFRYAWWLYMGNFFFLLFIALHVVKLARRPHLHFSAMTILGVAHLTTLTGIVFACVLSAITLLILHPHALAHAPAASGGRLNGLWFMVFLNAGLVNFSLGSFFSVLASGAIHWRRSGERPALPS
ncbi:hypothetical protein [Sediminibacterium soli]|uniref:hypothetical protein n=1 Tax=Sediminibacterium soli TaxID=2698829 RepID=UPI00137A54E7|nr:hypothetical protein [Sediminibacterium soli]NCI45539.1 hypothetical protein [Sediminibacterium soli]